MGKLMTPKLLLALESPFDYSNGFGGARDQDNYRDGWERVFGKKPKEPVEPLRMPWPIHDRYGDGWRRTFSPPEPVCPKCGGLGWLDDPDDPCDCEAGREAGAHCIGKDALCTACGKDPYDDEECRP